MRAITAVLVVACAAFIPGAIRAAALSDAERDVIAAAAATQPPLWPPQVAIDLVRRLAVEGNLEGLDLLLVLRHERLLDVYSRAFRDKQGDKLGAEIERRLLARYDDAVVAAALIPALKGYESRELFNRFLGDATRLAGIYLEESRRCRYVPIPMRNPQARYAIDSVEPDLQCEGKVPTEGPTAPRMVAAAGIIGRTRLAEAPSRLRRVFVGLASAAAVDRGPVGTRPIYSPIGNRVANVQSIAELWRQEHFSAAVPELIAVSRQMPMQTLGADAILPILRALAEMDERAGTQAIGEWIERNAAGGPELSHAMLLEVIPLLGPVVPEAQIDVAALRERVLARIPSQSCATCANAFRSVEVQNAHLREQPAAALTSSARNNNYRIVRYLLSRGVSPSARDAYGDTPLTAAHRHFEMQKFLVEAGADVNVPGRDGQTPFHLEVAWFNAGAPEPYRALDFFLSKGADVNQIAASGTPLMTAVGKSPQLARYLLDHGARVDLANNPQRSTALHVAAQYGKSDVVEILLAANAKVDSADRGGVTPLHLAVRSRCLECARALISHGADVNIEIEGGLTPLLAAQDLHDEAMQELIKRHGGRVNYAFIAKRAAIAKLYEGSLGGMH